MILVIGWIGRHMYLGTWDITIVLCTLHQKETVVPFDQFDAERLVLTIVASTTVFPHQRIIVLCLEGFNIFWTSAENSPNTFLSVI